VKITGTKNGIHEHNKVAHSRVVRQHVTQALQERLLVVHTDSVWLRSLEMNLWQCTKLSMD